MKKNWTVFLNGADSSWSLGLGSFRRRKNALDFAAKAIQCVVTEDGEHPNDKVTVTVEWMG